MSRRFLGSFAIQITVAMVALACLVLGTLTAFGLTRLRFRGRGVIAGLVGAPLILPWLVIGLSALMAYGRPNIDRRCMCGHSSVTS